jgi:hypothetical protein
VRSCSISTAASSGRWRSTTTAPRPPRRSIRAARGRDARGRDARDARPNAIVLPARIERIDASADGTHVIVRGDGRAVAVALTEG